MVHEHPEFDPHPASKNEPQHSKDTQWPKENHHYLGGGFKHVLFSALLGEVIQFD